jgi:hypothetical protein
MRTNSAKHSPSNAARLISQFIEYALLKFLVVVGIHAADSITARALIIQRAIDDLG